MRLWLWCVCTAWISAPHTAAQHPPERPEVGVQPGWRRRSPGGATPAPLDDKKPAAVRGSGGRRAALSGPHVCGGRCCAGWTLSPKTRRCTKARCLPRCRNDGLCQPSNRCLCQRGFHGYRCQVSMVTLTPPSSGPLDLDLSSVVPAAESTTGTTMRTLVLNQTQEGPETPGQSGPGLEPNLASLKGPPEVNNHQVWIGDPEDPEEQAEVSAGLKTRSGPESTKDQGTAVDLNPGTRAEDRFSLELRAGPRLRLESNPGPRREKILVPPVSGDEEKMGGARKLSLREAQAVLLRKTLSQGGRGDKMAALLMKHVEKEQEKLLASTSSSSVTNSTTGVKTFYTQRGQYTVHFSSTAVLCPLLCKNGGVCLQKDRCLCPPAFSGKFCHIPAAASTNDIVKPAVAAANQELTRSEFLLPLGHSQEVSRSGTPSPSMVKVRVQHPPEASVKIHQVLKVSGFSPSLRISSSSGSAGAPAPAGVGVQAQTLRGDQTYNQQSGFKYCFREVKDGQCSAPLPGLRSQETCCRGVGKAWGISDCVLCPDSAGQNSSCPAGFRRSNATTCIDVNECLQPGLCENGLCVNTRGSYSCVCRAGFILDATHGICISQSVISEVKGQCFRVLGSGQGPTSCSLPILRNITKQICCCSRVGKAWGPHCQRCPYFGSVAFKEICPAGPGYQYSASALQFNQRASEQLGGRGALLVTHATQDSQGPGSRSSGASRPQDKPSPGGATSLASAGSVGTAGVVPRPGPSQSQAPPPSRVHPPPQPHLQSPPPPAEPPSRSRSVQTTPEDKIQTSARTTTHQNQNLHKQNQNRPESAVSQPRPQPPPNPTEDVDECRQNPCGAGGRCDNTPGSYRCSCRHGYKLSGNTCTDVDECVDPLQCPGQECVNSQGSFRCVSCRPGYQLLSRVCTDIDECRQAPCSNARCENTAGSYRCLCHHGYRLHNNTCTDVDECLEPSQCPGQECVNTLGSYRCVSCRPGYTLINRRCRDVDECEVEGSCPGRRCVNTEGSFSCVDCPPGHQDLDGVCRDVDECANVGACDADRVCVNTVGSFRCDCRPGYRTSGLGRSCKDVNECLEGDFCFPRGECVNTPGSYTCVCSQGFTLNDNSTSCIDVDECVRSGVCPDGRCVNTEGSFQCQCETGFSPNPERTACLDVDECVSSGGAVCGSQRCENTIGSFRCLTSCEPGYLVTPTGGCVDVNECANQTVCGEHASCQNLAGTYLCVCHQGFTSTADGKDCVDEDECVSLPGVCGSARCENVEGSFMCECDRPGDEFDAVSRRCVGAAGAAADPRYTSSSSSSTFHSSVVELAPLPAARPGELRECYYNLAERGTCSLLAANSSQQECCCTVGEGWGLGCQYHTCPPLDSADFLSLCPSGRGYVTSGQGGFSYRDVDECKRFQPEVCKNGVCVNNIPGYSCYCPSGYVYNSTLLECVDHDECEEQSCSGGLCINTVGSYYCSCSAPLVLDDTQRNCVNSSHLPVDENLPLCWQHVTADLVCQSPLLGAQFTFMDCCCLYGEGWGMKCALCPAPDSDDYASLCSSFLPGGFPDSFPDTGPGPGQGTGGGTGGAPPYLPPYSPDSFIPVLVPDYDEYSPAGGSRSGFRGRSPASFGPHRPSEFSTGFYSEGDSSQSRPPSYHLPLDPRAELGFGARPPPLSRPDGAPLSLAPLPGAPYQEEEEEEEEDGPWRPGPPFAPFPGRSGGGAPRRVYDRPYESFAGLSTEEDCGILHGCENGRCIRVAEGYTCDCYQGYELDMTSMTCTDVDECEDSVSVEFPCVNARCVNTEGSFRCVCRRGYIMSRRPNHCVAA